MLFQMICMLALGTKMRTGPKSFYLYMTAYVLLETYTVILFWISDHDGKKINKK